MRIENPLFGAGAFLATLGGLGLDMMGNTLANAYPNTPHWVWVVLFWTSVALTTAFPLWGVWVLFRRWVRRLPRVRLELEWPLSAGIADPIASANVLPPLLGVSDAPPTAKSAPAAPMPSPAPPDSSVWPQLEYLLAESEWSVGKQKDAIYEAAGELRSKAATGLITVWGREELKYGDVAYSELPITAAQWNDIDFDLSHLMEGAEQKGRQTIALRGDEHSVRHYHHLRVNSTAVKELWPKRAQSSAAQGIPGDLVTVIEAANQVFDHHRTHHLILGWEEMFPNANILKVIAQHMTGYKRVPAMPFWGQRFPSRRTEPVSYGDLVSMQLTDDGTALEKSPGHKIIWTPVYASQSLLDMYLDTISKTGNL